MKRPRCSRGAAAATAAAAAAAAGRGRAAAFKYIDCDNTLNFFELSFAFACEISSVNSSAKIAHEVRVSHNKRPEGHSATEPDYDPKAFLAIEVAHCPAGLR